MFISGEWHTQRAWKLYTPFSTSLALSIFSIWLFLNYISFYKKSNLVSNIFLWVLWAAPVNWTRRGSWKPLIYHALVQVVTGKSCFWLEVLGSETPMSFCPRMNCTQISSVLNGWVFTHVAQRVSVFLCLEMTVDGQNTMRSELKHVPLSLWNLSGPRRLFVKIYPKTEVFLSIVWLKHFRSIFSFADSENIFSGRLGDWVKLE